MVIKLIKFIKNLFFPISIFLIVLTTAIIFSYLAIDRSVLSKKQAATLLSSNVAYSIQRNLSTSLSATKALGALIVQYGEIKEFDSIASHMLGIYDGISSLQLAPDGIVTKIYPMKGNENAKGNLLDDPKRRTECLMAIKNKKLTLAGPYKLKQGGIGTIGRFPVFVHNQSDSVKFWGFTIVLIKLDELLNNSGLNILDSSGYFYKLWRIHPDSAKPYSFSTNINREVWDSSVQFSFQVPNGEWTLSIVPKNGWNNSNLSVLVFVFSVLISSLISYLVTLTFKQYNRIKENESKLLDINATKDKFFSLIAHDLKNPLGNFKQISTMLADSYDDFSEEERIEFINTLKLSSENIYSLLENLLIWSNSPRGLIKIKITEINIKALSDKILDLFTVSAKNKSIELHNYITQDSTVLSDINLLSTIFRNLISNSIKFTNENGRISLSLKIDVNYLIISVCDNGIGMSKETSSKLFQIKRNISTPGTMNESGTGLGLILCKEFIEKLGGSIWVESQLGQGSTFIFSIPR
ncbi:MAG: ATP-binding protein [Candidatus Kapabacteria bacterium]|nr:ATP-binding protein [Candidatus Kapabacteria bacterium]